MKHVLIYCHNEEVPLFKDRHAEFIKSGDVVRYRAIKWKIPEKADLIVTLPHHSNVIKEIFRGLNIKIEIWDGSKKGTVVVTPEQPKKEVTNGEVESKAGSGKEGSSGKEGRRSGQGRQEEVKSPIATSSPAVARQSDDMPVIPVSRNENPKS